jgi:hypothetical protein
VEARIRAIVEQAKESGQKLVLHRCTMCNYPCGWIFDPFQGLVYDCGCDCRWEGEHSETEDELVASLRTNSHILLDRFEAALGIGGTQ